MLRRSLAVPLALAGLFFGGDALAYVLNGYDWTWQPSPVNLPFKFNPAGFPGSQGTSTDRTNAFRNSLTAWSAQSGANVAYIDGGTTTSLSWTSDGVMIGEYEASYASAGTLALTQFWTLSPDQITECDIRFYGSAGGTPNPWSALPAGAPSGYFDLERVAIHETGHCLGMGHSKDSAAIMAPATVPGTGTSGRLLSKDDIAGIRAIYGGFVDQDKDGWSVPDDCNDANKAVNPSAVETWYDGVDANCDGRDDYDQDGDGERSKAYAGTDCNDLNPGIYAAAAEIWYDGIDQNCDGANDYDQDKDGVKAASAGGTDCNDANNKVFPGATDTWYDGVDSNCDGANDYDQDKDGAKASAYGGNDCVDTNAAIYVGATEIWYDGVDQNCDAANDYDQDKDGSKALSSGGTDCVDTNAGIRPGAPEVCNAVDDDCNGKVDDGPTGTGTWYQDSDGDGFGNNAVTQASCTQPAGYVSGGGDCKDTLAAVHPGTPETCDGVDQDCDGLTDEGFPSVTYWKDADADGYGNKAQATAACQQPVGTVTNDKDCADTNPAISPLATEVCDGVDQDCDGIADDGLAVVAYYRDVDADGYGNPLSSVSSCKLVTGYVASGDDCNDANRDIHPGAPELCDGIDQDCDGISDDGVGITTYWFDDDDDGYGNPLDPIRSCTRPAYTATNDDDCADQDKAIHPGVPEQCDGVDQDCDGIIDNNVVIQWFYEDSDGDGYGDPLGLAGSCKLPAGYAVDNTDCDDTNKNKNPGMTEVCDGVDQDCDALVDEGAGPTWYRDADADGFGDPATSKAACTAPSGYLGSATDCDDATNGVHPGMTEVCDGVDQDCDALVDEGTTTVLHRDADGDGHGDPAIQLASCSAVVGYVADTLDCDDTDATVWSAAPGYDANCELLPVDTAVDTSVDTSIDTSVPTDTAVHTDTAVDTDTANDTSGDADTDADSDSDTDSDSDSDADADADTDTAERSGCGCDGTSGAPLFLAFGVALAVRRRGLAVRRRGVRN